MYTTNSNAAWAAERGVGSTPYPPVQRIEDLQGQREFAVVTPEQCAELALSLGNEAELWFQPLIGGLSPEVAWRSLELFEAAVLPRLVDAGYRSGRAVPAASMFGELD